MIKYELYGLFCPNTDVIKYIGITKCGLDKRLKSHLRKPTNKNIAKWFDTLKENEQIPVIKLLKTLPTYNELLQSEIDEIKKYKELNFELYNLTDGGDINPMLGKTHTLETKMKISKIHKGKKYSQDEILFRKEILKKFWTNPEWADKVKLKMSFNTKGSKNPNWKGGTTFKSCKCGNKKSYYSDTCLNCRDMSGNKNPFFGKKHTQENLNKIKNKIKEYGGFQGSKNPNYKYNISEDELYDLYINQNKTIKEISSLYNCAINTINKKLRMYGINKPKSNIYNLDKDKILKHLKEGLNYVQIGKLFGCDNKTIHNYVKKNKLNE